MLISFQLQYTSEKYNIICNEIFPKFVFSPSPERLQSHQHRVQGLLDSLPLCDTVKKFLQFDKHVWCFTYTSGNAAFTTYIIVILIK